jgi:hypothetical protein
MADLDTVRTLSAGADNLAVLSVLRPDGTIHSSLVKAGVLSDPWLGDDVVGLVVAGNARKLGYLRSAARASVTFTAGWQWVSIEGPSRLAGPDDPPICDLERIPGALRAVFAAAGGTHEDWDAFDRAMAEERRCAVMVAPEHIISN